jgi:hypothetical protein
MSNPAPPVVIEELPPAPLAPVELPEAPVELPAPVLPSELQPSAPIKQTGTSQATS